MKQMTKIALATAGILSMGALTACQSTNTVTAKDADQPQRMHGHKYDRMSPEQREQMKQMRAEQKAVMSQIKTACDGKAAGAAVQIKAGEKTIDGTCAMVFKMDKQKRGEFKGQRGDMKGHRDGERGQFRTGHMQRGEPMTDAQRAELTKQFDQRLAERQAKQQAIAKACQGKTSGTAVQIKAGAQTLDGKCEVRFQPKMPVQSAAPAPAKAA
ncbi:hypothetical protein [Acinetobacter sp. ANC 3813]|uniref:hypothetical protein n=1 Tax=Acinetobacter sp. ANC 3813 TaxID=1977873 RepID=UPI000A352565|nr:hypothetical protein [Acinetobacter sp. ANC 3813]OTG89467.1 hypothetical protein B9T34_11430 [Acinetobacter sp. ANC 3813]